MYGGIGKEKVQKDVGVRMRLEMGCKEVKLRTFI